MFLKLENLNFENRILLYKIFEWRNDENTRLNSINTNIITIDIFNKIINKYKECDIAPIIIIKDNKEIGIITFIKDNENYFIGINIDPLYRNKGISSESINLLMNNNIIVNKKIIAKIKKTNIASIKLFSKKFIYMSEDDIFIQYYYNF